MSSQTSRDVGSDRPKFMAGGGVMGESMRLLDWTATPLGAVEGWPRTLRGAVSILLASKAQVILFAEPELVALYNDAYAPVFGTKHPWALGKPARECWAEIWDDVLGPLFRGVLESGEAFYAPDHAFYLERHGYLEETYFDVSYDPLRDENGDACGVFCIVSETTGDVVGRRRARSLRELVARTARAGTVEEVVTRAAETLAGYRQDLPFLLFYLVEDGGRTARLASGTGLQSDAVASPAVLACNEAMSGSWPIDEVLRDDGAVVVTDVEHRFGPLACGPYPESPRRAVALPITPPGSAQPLGILVAGVSSRLDLSDAYRGYFDLLAATVTASIANARAHEEERKRIEALAELDRT
ncbi:MAG: hypothetical protein ACRELX_11715, partial [Longimicrobiales bacterium]